MTVDDKILLDIQKQLGKIEKIDATTIAIKEDIAELKEKDITQSQDLENAYEKAKARQDSIRDDLQHQIDNNKTLILTVNESINTLNNNIDKMVKELSANMTKKLEDFDTRLRAIETKKEKTLARWYDRIIDKLSWAFILGGLAVLLKWLHAPAEVVSKFTN